MQIRLKMSSVLRFLLIVTLFTIVLCDYKRVCYYTNWAQYRNGAGKYLPEDYETGLCTHIIYSFAKINSTISPFGLQAYEWNDEDMYNRVIALKQNDPNLKVLLAVGGWTHGSYGFTHMVTNETTRATFVTSSIEYLNSYGFDGLDLDWEYPTQYGGSWYYSPPEDKQRYTNLVEELRVEFDKQSPPLLLTAAVWASADSARNTYEIVKISKALDFINLMSYDLNGSWNSRTGHHTDSGNPNRGGNNIIKSINYWLDTEFEGEKMDSTKLILGMASYGRTWKLDDGCGTWSIGSEVGPVRPGSPGPYTSSSGFLAFYEICDRDWQNHVCGDTTGNPVKAPYGSDGNNFIGYDDQESIIYKVEIMKNKNLGGFMFWALDLDDFKGTCSNEMLGRYPLIKAAKNATLGLPLMTQNCEDVTFSGTCPTTTTTVAPSGGCRVNPIGAWAGSDSMDSWCRNPGNCPQPNCEDYWSGCYYCRCICGTTTTTAVSTTTTVSSTLSTTKPTTVSSTVSTTKPTTASSTVSTTKPTTASSTVSTTKTTSTVSTTKPTTLTSTVSTTKPTTVTSTVSTTKPTTDSSTVSTTKPTTASSTVSTTKPTTASSTVSTTKPTTESSTVSTVSTTKTTSTVSTTKPTTLTSTASTTKPITVTSTVSITKPTTDSSIASTTKPTTVTSTVLTRKPTTESSTVSTTKTTSTVSTTKPTTLTSTVSTTKPTTVTSTVSTTKPTTDSSPVSTTKPTTASSTVSTTKPTTESSTVSTTKPTTASSTVSTTKPTTDSSTASTTKTTSTVSTTSETTTCEMPLFGNRKDCEANLNGRYGKMAFLVNWCRTKCVGNARCSTVLCCCKKIA